MKDIREDIAWAKINKDVLKSLENPRPLYWVILFIAIAMVGVAVGCEVYQYNEGLGVANFSNPHVWGLYIATFIFWIGMSHSGTLLSAILHLMHADWRKPIYRFAEAMTTFSLMTAGLFVAVHLGRLWQIYFALPYPNMRQVWPNFQSPLLWDAMAIFTYLSSSILFLYVGMIPDLAICRDNMNPGWRKKLYTALALGWEGTDRQWRNFRITYLTIACFLIPLAVSVHSIVASDFAMSQQPGWHITSFPPYFVAGALYSGCAAIITLFVILRYVFKFEEYMTLSILKKIVRLTFRDCDGVDIPESDRIRVGLVWARPGRQGCADPESHRTLCAVLVGDELLRLGRPVHHVFQAFPNQHPGDVRSIAAAQPGHVAGALDDRCTDFLAWLLPVDLGSRPVAQSGAMGYRVRQFWLVCDVVHDFLQDIPVGFHV